jgi:hypothetical protein
VTLGRAPDPASPGFSLPPPGLKATLEGVERRRVRDAPSVSGAAGNGGVGTGYASQIRRYGRVCQAWSTNLACLADQGLWARGAIRAQPGVVSQ